MPSTPVKIDTLTRLNRNLGLMQAGSTVSIDISTPAGQKGKFRTTFIGYMPKQYVLLQYPDSHKLGNFAQYIVQGVGVTVRGLIEGHEGAVAAFLSSVKQTISIPSKIMVLEFPKTITLQHLRNSLRLETDIRAKLKIAQQYWSVIISDVSINGCQLSIGNGEELAVGKEKQVEIIIEDYEGITNLKLHAEICNVKNQPFGILMGLKFSEQSRKDVSKLLHHIVELEA